MAKTLTISITKEGEDELERLKTSLISKGVTFFDGAAERDLSMEALIKIMLGFGSRCVYALEDGVQVDPEEILELLMKGADVSYH